MMTADECYGEPEYDDAEERLEAAQDPVDEGTGEHDVDIRFVNMSYVVLLFP